MHTEQGIQHLLALLQYGHSSDDLMGRLIRGSLETLILKLGIPDNPFMQDYTALHLLATNSWIKSSVAIPTPTPHPNWDGPTNFKHIPGKWLIPHMKLQTSRLKRSQISQNQPMQNLSKSYHTGRHLQWDRGVYSTRHVGQLTQSDIYHRVPMAKPRKTTQNRLDNVAIGITTGLSSKPSTKAIATIRRVAPCTEPTHPPLALANIILYTKTVSWDQTNGQFMPGIEDTHTATQNIMPRRVEKC